MFYENSLDLRPDPNLIFMVLIVSLEKFEKMYFWKK